MIRIESPFDFSEKTFDNINFGEKFNTRRFDFARELMASFKVVDVVITPPLPRDRGTARTAISGSCRQPN